MAENKTKKTDESVDEFMAGIEDEQKREDTKELLKLFKNVSGEEPKMWGSIIGFGDFHYKYASGREGDWFITGFSPRKQNLTIYLMDSYNLKLHKKLLEKLGEYKAGKSCLYIKNLKQIDNSVLEKIIENSIRRVREGTYLGG